MGKVREDDAAVAARVASDDVLVFRTGVEKTCCCSSGNDDSPEAYMVVTAGVGGSEGEAVGRGLDRVLPALEPVMALPHLKRAAKETG